MSTINQAWIFIALITTCSASSLLLVMHRVLASAQFVANQRRITAGIIYFSIVELVAVGVPVSVLTACCCLSMGNVVVAHYALISIALYPVFAPYYVLMSNTEYRRRVVELTTRGRKVTILQPDSINS
ncbi:unnamed protein product [Auanema sp. JU1783]|nr:unnamed protein product [Auanema sp. JU1783]